MHWCPGDTAFALLREGADPSKKDSEGYLAIDLAPDSQVHTQSLVACPILVIWLTLHLGS